MTSTAAAIGAVLPPDNELVVGTVTSVTPFIVTSRGGPINNPGVLGSYRPGLGDPVQMLRQDGTWLVMGASASAVDAAAGLGSYNLPGTADTTALGTYTNLDPVRFGFVKRLPGSTVIVDAHVSCYSTAIATSVLYGIDFLAMGGGAVSVRKDLMGMQLNNANLHTMISATAPFTGIAAGTYDVQILWRRTAGAGTLTINSDDWTSIMVTEAN